MRKLLPGLAIGLSLVAFPLASTVLPAFAQDDTATVTIDGAFAEDLSLATGIPLDDLPETLSVPVDVASTVCGTAVAAGETCAGTTSAASLAEFLESSDSSESRSALPRTERRVVCAICDVAFRKLSTCTTAQFGSTTRK